MGEGLEGSVDERCELLCGGYSISCKCKDYCCALEYMFLSVVRAPRIGFLGAGMNNADTVMLPLFEGLTVWSHFLGVGWLMRLFGSGW